MSDLSDLFKVIAEGKKHYEETDPKGKLKKQIREEIKAETKVGLADLMKELASLKEQAEKMEQEEKPVTAKVEDQITDAVTVTPPPPPEPIVEDMGWGQNDIQQYVKSDAFKQGKTVTDVAKQETPELRALKDKIKLLEQWVSRIASTGPGSGEVNFRYLDDVDRSTMEPENDNWVLEYNTANGHVQFTEDIGPIRTIKLNTTGRIIDSVPGMLSFNTDEDCLDVYHADGSVLQAGLEQHMQVFNGTGNTLLNGTVVRFAGVNGDGDETPIVVPHIANGTIPPLYTVGILTNSIANNTVGRATTYGKVRNLNTTGSDVSETWNIGDILYVSTTIPGKLTKVKPTAPNIVVPIAAVLKKDANTGILLVRPTIFPRLYYGSFSDTTYHFANTINTPYNITLNTVDVANGFTRANSNTRIVAQNSGLYNFQFSAQLISTSSSAKNVWIWPRKNGQDIPNSATRKTITGNQQFDVASWNFIVSLKENEYFELMWAVDDPTIYIPAPASTNFCPAIPSVILTVTEAAL